MMVEYVVAQQSVEQTYQRELQHFFVVEVVMLVPVLVLVVVVGAAALLRDHCMLL